MNNMLEKYFKTPYENFPIYVYEKFLIPTEEEHDHTVKYCIRTFSHYKKTLNKYIKGYNFPIKPYGFIKKLAEKYNSILEECFDEKIYDKSVFTYVSNKDLYFDLWHTHTHTGSSVTAVYYLQIEEGKSPIEFEKNGSIIEYHPKSYDLILFPHNLNHRPTSKDLNEDYRISLAMDRIYQPQDKILKILENNHE